MPVQMSFETFEELVNQAIDELPAEMVSMIDNCIVVIEPEPPDGNLNLLGLYEGIPLPQRNSGYAMALPDRIFVFMGPTLRMCGTRAEVVEEVRITIVHEIAHHLGISDETLHVWGYG